MRQYFSIAPLANVGRDSVRAGYDILSDGRNTDRYFSIAPPANVGRDSVRAALYFGGLINEAKNRAAGIAG